MENVAEDFTG